MTSKEFDDITVALFEEATKRTGMNYCQTCGNTDVVTDMELVKKEDKVGDFIVSGGNFGWLLDTYEKFTLVQQCTKCNKGFKCKLDPQQLVDFVGVGIIDVAVYEGHDKLFKEFSVEQQYKEQFSRVYITSYYLLKYFKNKIEKKKKA